MNLSPETTESKKTKAIYFLSLDTNFKEVSIRRQHVRSGEDQYRHYTLTRSSLARLLMIVPLARITHSSAPQFSFYGWSDHDGFHEGIQHKY